MKKIIIFALIFVLNLSLVNADILPDITRDQKIISGKNILNVADYPEWTFFQKAFKYGEDLFEIIPDNGNLGCNGGSVGVAMEIWAVKDISKVEGIIEELDTEGNYVVEEEIYNRLNKNNSSDNFIKKEEVYGHLTEKGAIKLAESGDFKTIGCSVVVGKKSGLTEKVIYLTIVPEMFYLSREFRLNNNLSDKTKENLKIGVKLSYEKFKVNLEKLSLDKQETTVKTLVFEIDNLLREEKRESAIFALSYLKYLSVNG